MIHLAKARINPPFAEHRIAETVACLTFPGFLGNIAFLQNTLVPVFGSNGPLWSLNYEFWYYIMFPLGFFVLSSRYGRALRVAFAAGLIFLLLSLGWPLVVDAPIWVFGALLFYFQRSNFSESARRVTLVLYVCAFIGSVELSFRFPLLADYLLGAVTCMMLWVVLSARSAANLRSWPTRSSRLLAKFSYTLYLVHVPIFTFAGVFLVRDQPWRPDLPHLACAFAIWLATILFALWVASLTEFRTDTVRRSIETWSSRLEVLSDPKVG
jgi:peptidoglycan/LPS O-acetylase OafA/YrhL